MSMHDDIKNVLVSEEELKAKVRELGAQISRDYEGKNLVLVSILKGSVVFMADLMRAVSIPCSIDFMVVSSYGGSNTSSSGLVKIIKDLDGDLSGKDVLIVEDILDTGITLSNLVPMLKMRHPNSVKICPPSWTNPAAARRISSRITRASRCRMSSWWAMAWITTKNTATCRISASSNPAFTRNKNITRTGVDHSCNQKDPRINPLIFALALAAVLMIWSVFTSGTGMSGGSTMSYSTVVHYFERDQVTKFTTGPQHQRHYPDAERGRPRPAAGYSCLHGRFHRRPAVRDAVVFVGGFHGRGEELGRYRDCPLQAALCLRFH